MTASAQYTAGRRNMEGLMRASGEVFTCVECGIDMERVEAVPVLQSLEHHLIHRCAACGHILLVSEERAEDWSAGWLAPLLELDPAITCVCAV
jgi:predicted RNA-binding Zn-ribbon protein involved in translation (DUF1610 family)